MFSPFANAGLFLLETAFDLYIFILMLRVVLQWVGAKFYNPISQIVVKLTNPLIKPLRRILPPFKGIDLAAFFLLVILEFIKLLLLIWLKNGALPGIAGLLVISFADILDVILDIFFYAIIIVIIMSWVNPMSRNPMTETLHLVTEPLLRPARRIIPSIAGFDFSPIAVLILLQICAIVIVQPLIAIGLQLIS